MIKSVFEQLKNGLIYEKNWGLELDIEDYFLGDPLIRNYSINKIGDSKYLILISLFELNIFNSKDIFERFCSYIGYSEGCFYVRENTDEQIKYYFISFQDSLKGVYCEVVFE